MTEPRSIPGTITGCRVDQQQQAPAPTTSPKRPYRLGGTTYKRKYPDSDNALYVTINDTVENAGTPREKVVPHEMFINSKNMEHYQWTVALTRVISAVFRQEGDNCGFIADELKSVFDPKGGFFRHRQFVPSIVADLGYVIEEHLAAIGDEAPLPPAAPAPEPQPAAAAPSGELCQKCMSFSVVRDGGCSQCLNCGDAKCG